MDADATEVAGGQTGAEPRPGRSPVRRLVDSALRTPADVREDVPPPLPRGGIDHIRVARVHRNVRYAGVFADVQNPFPAPSAVGRLVEPAVTARPPQRTLRRDVDDIRIPRIDRDPPNMFGGL